MPDMDKAAQDAAQELNPGWTAQEVAQWWAKWYHQAGHKRLGRLLVELSKRSVASKVSS